MSGDGFFVSQRFIQNKNTRQRAYKRKKYTFLSAVFQSAFNISVRHFLSYRVAYVLFLRQQSVLRLLAGIPVYTGTVFCCPPVFPFCRLCSFPFYRSTPCGKKSLLFSSCGQNLTFTRQQYFRAFCIQISEKKYYSFFYKAFMVCMLLFTVCRMLCSYFFPSFLSGTFKKYFYYSVSSCRYFSYNGSIVFFRKAVPFFSHGLYSLHKPENLRP